MNTCLKPFTLKVAAGLSPFLWWPMEELGENGRIDTVQGLHLTLTFEADALTSANAGKVALGMQFASPGATAGFESDWSALPVPPSTWVGMEFDFWARWDFWSDAGLQALQWILCDAFLDYTNGGGGQAYEFQMYYFQGNLQLFVSDSGGIFSNLAVPFVPVAGTFYFFTVFHDVASGRFGVAINNAAPTTQVVVSAPTGTMDDLTLTISFRNGNPNPTTPVTRVRIDEYAVFTSAQSAATRTAIYNSGSGRTYP